MKKIVLLLLIINSCVAYCFGQDNPYAVFGYKPAVEYKDSKQDIFWVKNTDITAKVRFFEFYLGNHQVKLFDRRDSLLESVTIDDDKVLRFLSVDPISAKYPELTPYQFASNRPIDGIDRDGLEHEESVGGDNGGLEIFNLFLPKEKRLSVKQITNIESARNKGAAMGSGIGLATALTVYYAPYLLTATPTFLLENPQTARGVAVGIIAAVTGYAGPDLPGGEWDDFERLGDQGYKALISRGLSSQHDLGVEARSSYNKIIGTIDYEIKDISSIKGKAMKAFSIRNAAKDFARALSGPENKAAAEAASTANHGNVNGPSFEELFKKYKDAGNTDDQAYQEIINSAKRPNPEVNAKYQKPNGSNN